MNQGRAIDSQVPTTSQGSMEGEAFSTSALQLNEVQDIFGFDDDTGSEKTAISPSDGAREDSSHAVVPPLLDPAAVSEPSQPVEKIRAVQSPNTKKRKSPVHLLKSLTSTAPAKKAKLDEAEPAGPADSKPLPADKSMLHPAIWHCIFTFVSPQGLGILLQVNKLLNSYLSASLPQCQVRPSPSGGFLVTLPADLIWRKSRRRHFPNMPGPLSGKTELEMWRLLRGNLCQFCGSGSQESPRPVNARSKPSAETDRIQLIWPFAVRSCGSCLLVNSTKEIDLLLSPSVPSILLPALPFVLVTQDLRVFSPGMLGRGLPSNQSLTKIYFSRHVDDLQGEFEAVKNLGTGAVEEWLKGQEEQGKERRTDANRWQKLHLNGDVLEWQSRSRSSKVPPLAEPHIVRKKGTHRVSHFAGFADSGSTTAAVSSDPNSKLQPIVSLQIQSDVPCSRSELPNQPCQFGFHPKRTLQEALSLKAARRLEIERRAMLLKPPLVPNVLNHIPAFQAALQIILPLDDIAWEMLKPRLLLQRADAELYEEHEKHRIRTPQNAEQRHLDGTGTKVSAGKELEDKNWDDAQAPLRAQISMYADQIMRDAWNDGNDVDKDTGPRFAVEVLLHVRDRFYAHIARESAAARAEGKNPAMDPPMGPYTRKLTLENMKWLFEVKIKPYTEPYGKELFLCNGCDDSLKAYGFEGVIQHYAAKHTTSMSVGSIVVYWRSEWPENPPFHPDPVARNAQGRKRRNAPLRMFLSGNSQQHSHGHRRFASSHGLPDVPIGPPQHHQYTQTGSQPQDGQWGSPLLPVLRYDPSYAQLTGGVLYIPPALGGPQPPSHHPQHCGSDFQGPHIAGNYYDNQNAVGTIGQAAYPISNGGPQSDLMRIQLEELIRSSRQIWLATAGIKELPGYVRVQVFLHHLAKRYRSRWSESPPLLMFIDSLSNYKEMRPVRNVNELMCKACHLGMWHDAPREGIRTSFSLPQLAKHFQQKHLEPLQAVGEQLLDWTVDMVFLPDLPCLSNLKAMIGMDSLKYQLIVEAFSSAAFSAPHYGREPPGQPKPHRYQSTIIAPESHSLHPYTSDGIRPLDYMYGHMMSHYRQDDHDGLPQVPQRASFNIYAEHHSADRWLPEEPSNNYSTPATEQHPAVLSSTMQTTDHHRREEPAESPAARYTPRNSCGMKRRDQRPKSRPGSKLKDVNEKAGTEEDKEAEAEAQREGDVIRAMWAADREATARMASTSVRTQWVQSESSDESLGNIPQEPARTPDPQAKLNGSEVSAVVKDRQGSPNLIADHDDLFSSLELYLDQQCETRSADIVATTSPSSCSTIAGAGQNSGHTEAIPITTSRIAHKDRPSRPSSRQSTSMVDLSPERYHQRQGTDPRRSDFEHARETPETMATASVHNSQASRYVGDDHRVSPVNRRAMHDERPQWYMAASRQYSDNRSLEPMSRVESPPIIYATVYERLLVRDARGDEYYIERPIRYETERVYVRHENE